MKTMVKMKRMTMSGVNHTGNKSKIEEAANRFAKVLETTGARLEEEWKLVSEANSKG